MSEDNWPKSFDDEAYQLIGRIIALWSRLDDGIRSRIHGLQTHIYVLQARSFRREHGISHFGKVIRPDDIPHAKFKLRWRYFRLLMNNINFHNVKVKDDLNRIGEEVYRLQKIRNDIAHCSISVSSPWNPPSISLHSSAWLDDWTRKYKSGVDIRKCRPRRSYNLSRNDLNKVIEDLNSVEMSLLRIPTPFDEFNPPEQPMAPS